MNHAIKQDYNGDEFDALLSAELLLPNESANGFIRVTIVKRAENNLGQAILDSISSTYPMAWNESSNIT